MSPTSPAITQGPGRAVNSPSASASALSVVVTDFIEDNLDWEEQEFASAGLTFQTHQLKHEPEDDLIRATREADIIIVNMARITPLVVESWKRCRLVIRHGIGYDNVDVRALTRAGIPLVNIPDYCVEEVAEHAIALILNAARKVTVSQKILRASIELGRWDFRAAVPVHRMKDQQLGIIGCGRIGSRVYQKLSHFGFRLAVCDPYLSEERRVSLGVHPISLDQLLSTSDFVTLHAPLNADTRRLINANTLRQMKSTAYLVNTARAGLIDQDALVAALEQGTIAGAALDVFEQEPPLPSDPLLNIENVVLTPHLSWYSIEAEWSIRRSIVRIVNEFAAGMTLQNVVNSVELGEMK